MNFKILLFSVISAVLAILTYKLLTESVNESVKDKPVLKKEITMKRVTGIGGVFFKSEDPKKLKSWYKKHLGLNTGDYGTNFEWRKSDTPEEKGFTLWAPFNEKTKYFSPSEKQFMMNYRVQDLEWLVEQLEKEGIKTLDSIESTSYGKFVHIMDPEGNKIELWEAYDEEYEKLGDEITK